MDGGLRSPTVSADGKARFVRFAYELGYARATGVLRVEPLRGPTDSIEVREGSLVGVDPDPLGRRAGELLGRLASLENALLTFEDRPIEARGRMPLEEWARKSIEREVDVELAEHIGRELHGVHVRVRPERVPTRLDASDRLLIEALARPRRVAELSALVRLPRYRVFAFLHFLRVVEALVVFAPATAPASKPAHGARAFAPPIPAAAARGEGRCEALRLLGLPPEADAQLVKSAFRRIAKALHPDLHPHVGEAGRRDLERRMTMVNAAYSALTAG